MASKTQVTKKKRLKRDNKKITARRKKQAKENKKELEAMEASK